MNKAELRRSILTWRSKLVRHEVLQASALIAARLEKFSFFDKASAVMCYVSFRNEVETAFLITKMLETGKKVALPFCHQEERRLDPVVIENFPGDLVPGTWGILEPVPGKHKAMAFSELDLVLVPGVAFDEQGDRIGYGAGYYDRFLKKAARAVTVGLAMEGQVVQSVQPEAHDIRLDYVFTEKRVIKGSPER